MRVEHKYSLVFQPYEKEVDYIKVLKYKLAEEIGWFASKDAQAHLSIAEFYADEQALQQVIKYLQEVVRTEKRQYVYLDSFGSFPQKGTFYVKPTVSSRMFLKSVIGRVIAEMPIPISHVPEEIHLTIGRKLTENQLAIAFTLFPFIDMDFMCDRLVLRQFDSEKKQYQEKMLFPFLAQPKVQEVIDPNGQFGLF